MGKVCIPTREKRIAMPPVGGGMGGEQCLVLEYWHCPWGAGSHHFLWCTMVRWHWGDGSVLHAAGAEQRAPISNGERGWVSGWRKRERLGWLPTCASWLRKRGWGRGDMLKMPLRVRHRERIGEQQEEALPVWGPGRGQQWHPEGSIIVTEFGRRQTPAASQSGWGMERVLPSCFSLNWKKMLFSSSFWFFHMSFLVFIF